MANKPVAFVTQTTEFAIKNPSFMPAYDELSGHFPGSGSAGRKVKEGNAWRTPVDPF